MRGQVPALRNTNPAVPLALPYGLGEMNRKKPVVVDAALAPAWVDIVTALSLSLSLAQAPAQGAASAGPGAAAAGGGALDQARALSGLVARALSPPGVDAAAPAATPESTPCAAAALKGRAADDDNAGPPGGAVPDGTPYPALARYFFLPPGQVRALLIPLSPWLSRSPDTASACPLWQAGATATSLGPARWVTQVRAWPAR